jgi:type I restriction enzyme S subunit
MAMPKLRFKEFDGDWEETSLSKLMSYFKGYAFKSKSYQESGIRIVRVSDLGRDKIKNHTNAIYLDKSEEETYKKWAIKTSDIIITTVGSKPHLIDSAVGRPIFIRNDKEGLLNQNLLILRPIDKHTDAYFIYSQLTDRKYLNHIENIQRGNANQSNITVKDLLKFNILKTKEKEQTKIATFLTAVDTKIDELIQKHELLSEYKKGMMQQLFSQKLRFKADDGSDFEDWEESKFSECFTFHMTNALSRAKLSEQGDVMNIHYGDIHTKFSTLFDTTKEEVSFIKNKTDTLKIKSDQFLQIGDLVIADASEDYNDIGKTLEIINLDGKKAVAGLHTYIARPDQIHATGFCGYMMQSAKVRKQIKVLATGISVLGISKTNLNKLDLAIPSLPEQTKIANFLTAIDQKIDNVAEQIDHAKTWKKGLLQQMFV